MPIAFVCLQSSVLTAVWGIDKHAFKDLGINSGFSKSPRLQMANEICYGTPNIKLNRLFILNKMPLSRFGDGREYFFLVPLAMITPLMSPSNLTAAKKLEAFLLQSNTLHWKVHYKMEMDAATATCITAFRFTFFLVKKNTEITHTACWILMRLICFRNTYISVL